ncbi:hypothetical protein [Amycolatopsis rubida]|uniref:Uncharacterized protein n=1 Tax=Amycolatopsis rubida TaxID=112413 RepID=A0A1I5MH21_9PSEU|nr:hypothetical protein [Amycolatopsis rubida]SFP08813.1 hypothetical protein SAMN05421854_10444 [Amycolatopsis rubida]
MSAPIIITEGQIWERYLDHNRTVRMVVNEYVGGDKWEVLFLSGRSKGRCETLSESGIRLCYSLGKPAHSVRKNKPLPKVRVQR